MRDLGCDVDVVTPGRVTSLTREDGISVARFDITGQGHLLGCRRGDRATLAEYLAGRRWDLVIAHCWQAWTTNALLDYFLKHRRTEKLVLVSHGISTRTNVHSVPLSWLRRFLWLPYEKIAVPRYLTALDRLVVLWERRDDGRFYDQSIAANRGVQIRPIPNVATYEPEELVHPRELCGRVGPADGFLLSVGAYSRLKNERFVLDAYRRSRLPDVPLVFVGQEPNRYLSGLERLAREWRLHNVHFCHGLEKPEINWLYHHATLVLSGSRTECQPISVLDALSAQKPCISTDVGCVAQLDGVVVVQNVGQMAAEISRLRSDPSARAELAERGHAMFTRQFTRQAAQTRWALLLQELIPGWMPPGDVSAFGAFSSQRVARRSEA